MTRKFKKFAKRLDAKHIAGRIVKHMWIIGVVLPVIIAVLAALVGLLK